MVVNENNPKIWASLTAPNPDDVTYWVDLTADPHGNIIKFYDENDEKWYNLTSPTSDYAVYPYIGPNGIGSSRIRIPVCLHLVKYLTQR